MQVSLPRNLAHWPGFLALYWTLLAPLHDAGTLRASIDAVIESGHVRGRRLARLLRVTPELPAQTRNEVLAALENLVPNAMRRMIPVVALLKRAMLWG